MLRRFMVHFSPIALGIFAALDSGCVTRHAVRLDATAAIATTPATTSYQILTHGLDDDLRAREVAGYVKTALSARGWFEAPDGRAADMIVDIDVAVGPPHATYVEDEAPQFGVSLVQLAHLPPGGEVDIDDVLEREKSATVVMVRDKTLALIAYDNHAADSAGRRELWHVHASIEDESDDLRRYLPVLAAAAMDEIGQNRGEPHTAIVAETGGAVAFITRGL